MELNFNHFSIKTQPGMEDDPVKAGFLMHHTDRWAGRQAGRQRHNRVHVLCAVCPCRLFSFYKTHPSIQTHTKPTTTNNNSETTARQSIESALERLEADRDDCWLDHPGPKDEVIDMSDPGTWQQGQVGFV